MLSQSRASVLPGKTFTLFATLNGEVCQSLYWTVSNKNIASITADSYASVQSNIVALNSIARAALTTSDIVGTWKSQMSSMTYIFKADNTGSLDAPNVGTAEFNWEFDTFLPNKVVITFTYATGSLSSYKGGQQSGLVSEDGTTMTGDVGMLTKTSNSTSGGSSGGSGGGNSGGSGTGGGMSVEGAVCIVGGLLQGSTTITVQTRDYKHKATCTVTVTETGISANSLTLDKNEVEIGNGEKIILYPKFSPVNATDQNITWTSSNTNVATVNKYGVVTGVAMHTGTVTIRAYSAIHDLEVSCEVKVRGGFLDKDSVWQVFDGDLREVSSVTIPSYITTINDVSYLQEITENLQEIKVEEDNENFVVVDGVLFNKDKTKLIWYPHKKTDESYNIPDGVKIIGDGAFRNCTSLLEVEIPDTVETIGKHAFYDCYGITDLTFRKDDRKNGIKNIKEGAFCGCTGITSLEIPGSIERIEKYAFAVGASSYKVDGEDFYNESYRESALTSVTIAGSWGTKTDSTLRTIDNYAFYYCKNLTDITLPTDIIQTDIASSNGSKFGNIFRLGDYSYDCFNVTVVKGYGYREKYGDPQYEETDVIANYAFKDCASIKSIKIEEGIRSIGNYAFYGCSRLESVNITSSYVDSIGNYAFSGCSELESVEFPTYVDSIGNHAFYNCFRLKNFEIPKYTESIGDYAFYGCSSLESVAIPYNLKSIGSYMFASCSSLKRVEIPSSVTSIGSYAFYYCYSLEQVEIPNSVTSIRDVAFYNCSSLKSVTIYRNTPPTLYSNAFSYNSDGRKFYVPEDYVDTYQSATNWKNYADDIEAIQY